MADHVKVTHVAGEGADGDGGYGAAVLQWDAGPLADCVADAVVSVLLQEQGKPAAVGAAEEARKCAPPPALPPCLFLAAPRASNCVTAESTGADKYSETVSYEASVTRTATTQQPAHTQARLPHNPSDASIGHGLGSC